ncbi:protein NEL-like isoform X2 [Orbicella faveolata]|uniref:protein NEL-like isoform X2 n=1 Tax=Orbicella faveolata TaxID=48498 RepID=UPI0009E3FDF0|nr:protein NEL-like isoform X2 [Orbicella faveolata]
MLFALDIDECEEETYSCPKFSRCKNKNGGYDCPCKDGFEKTAQGTCSEICTPECDENSYCENGKCLCRRGFSLGLDYTCQPSEGLLRSGISLHSPAILLTAALLWCVALI